MKENLKVKTDPKIDGWKEIENEGEKKEKKYINKTEVVQSKKKYFEEREV